MQIVSKDTLMAMIGAFLGWQGAMVAKVLFATATQWPRENSKMNVFLFRAKFCLTLAVSLAWFALSPRQLPGQTMVSPAFKKDRPAVDPVVEPKKVIAIRAAGEPDPAFRYRFWPAPENRRNGNPMPFISRAILLSVQARQGDASGEYVEQYGKLSGLPIDDLPSDEVHDFLAKYATRPLREL